MRAGETSVIRYCLGPAATCLQCEDPSLRASTLPCTTALRPTWAIVGPRQPVGRQPGLAARHHGSALWPRQPACISSPPDRTIPYTQPILLRPPTSSLSRPSRCIARVRILQGVMGCSQETTAVAGPTTVYPTWHEVCPGCFAASINRSSTFMRRVKAGL